MGGAEVRPRAGRSRKRTCRPAGSCVGRGGARGRLVLGGQVPRVASGARSPPEEAAAVGAGLGARGCPFPPSRGCSLSAGVSSSRPGVSWPLLTVLADAPPAALGHPSVSRLPRRGAAPLGWLVPADAQLAQKAGHRPSSGGPGLVLAAPGSSPGFFLGPPGRTLSPRVHVRLPGCAPECGPACGEAGAAARRAKTVDRGFPLSGSGPSIAAAQ